MFIITIGLTRSWQWNQQVLGYFVHKLLHFKYVDLITFQSLIHSHMYQSPVVTPCYSICTSKMNVTHFISHPNPKRILDFVTLFFWRKVLSLSVRASLILIKDGISNSYMEIETDFLKKSCVFVSCRIVIQELNPFEVNSSHKEQPIQ